jgi:hypothetical protein
MVIACKHEVPEPKPIDGGSSGSNSCDTNVVYFQQQILPILVSNCTQSGCHNADDAANQIILTNYDKIIAADVDEILEAITENDPDKVMPRPPDPPLTSEQIGLIQKWIQQGSKNNSCDLGSFGCDTTSVTYNLSVKPILQLKCVGCHSGPSPSYNLSLATWSDVNAVALSGSLVGSINHAPPYFPMPKYGSKLSNCEIRKIEIWISQGALDN